jgi:adenylate cyclase
VRITAQLIDGATDNHIWAERYDRELEDVFEVQDEITASIAATIEPELRRAEFSRAMIVRPESLTVWDIYQRGLWHMYRKIPDNHAALDLFEQAANLDPNFGLAYSGIADACYFLVHYHEVEDSENYMDRGMAAAQRAVELDDDDPTARLALVRQLTRRRNYEEALVEAEYATQLIPLGAEPRQILGRILVDLGRFSETIEAMQEALRVNPNDVSIGIVMARLAEAHFHLGDYDKAVYWSREAARQSKAPRMWGRVTLIAALGHRGDADGSKAELENMLEQRPEFSLTFVRQHYPLDIPEALERMISGLQKAGVPE